MQSHKETLCENGSMKQCTEPQIVKWNIENGRSNADEKLNWGHVTYGEKKSTIKKCVESLFSKENKDIWLIYMKWKLIKDKS